MPGGPWHGAAKVLMIEPTNGGTQLTSASHFALSSEPEKVTAELGYHPGETR